MDKRLLKVVKALIGVSRSWTELEDNYLEAWWGHKSASDIGRDMGRTKNSVVGRAFRQQYGKKEDEPVHDYSPVFEQHDQPLLYTGLPVFEFEFKYRCKAPECTANKQPGLMYCNIHHYKFIVSKMDRVNRSSVFSSQGKSNIA